MRKIPTTREHVIAAWEKTKEAAKRLADAKAKLEALPDKVPDIAALQAAIDIFRAEHAETKRRREAEFLAAQCLAKSIFDAGEEVLRAKKALDIATRNQVQAESRLVV